MIKNDYAANIVSAYLEQDKANKLAGLIVTLEKRNKQAADSVWDIPYTM